MNVTAPPSSGTAKKPAYLLEGRGVWIAFPKMVGDGSPAALVKRLQYLGASWVAPRGGNRSTRDPSWTAAHTDACNFVGIKVLRWVYSAPQSWGGEVKLAVQFKSEGDYGFIIDAEMPWELGGNWRTDAARYMSLIDSQLGPDYPVFDAPWPYIFNHMKPDGFGFPAVEFGERCNARMLQSYWTEISAAGAAFHLPKIDAQWEHFDALFPHAARPVWPIGITYGRAELKKWGGQQLPPGEVTVGDIDIYEARYPLKHYYSAEASNPAVAAHLHQLAFPGSMAGPHPDDVDLGQRLLKLPVAEQNEVMAFMARRIGLAA